MDKEVFFILKNLIYSQEEKMELLIDMRESLKIQKKSIQKKIVLIDKQIKKLLEG